MKICKAKVKCQFTQKEDLESFLSMLKTMQYFGNIGHTEFVGMKIDGDGTCKPKFKIKSKYKTI